MISNRIDGANGARASAPAELSTAWRFRAPRADRNGFLPFGAPSIEEPEIEEVVATLRSGWLGAGARLAQFERAFAEYRSVDPELAVGVASASSALHLSLVAAGIGPGDEVVTSALTYCATINAILQTGATPVPIDVDPRTYDLDPIAVERALSSRTRALLPVHFAGRPCEMDALRAIAERRDLFLIEDCAHAIEAELGGRAAGTFGGFGCFSFSVGKNLTTGEGGMVLAPSRELARRVRRLARHGLEQDAWERFGASEFRQAWVVEPGFKAGMSDLQAALGLHQLARIEANARRREAIWGAYEEGLCDLPLALPAPPRPGTRHARHLFTVRVEEAVAGISRGAFIERMLAAGIGVGVHYPSVAEHPYYQRAFGWSPSWTPHATRIGRQTVSLPLYPSLTDTDVESVVRAVRGALESERNERSRTAASA